MTRPKDHGPVGNTLAMLHTCDYRLCYILVTIETESSEETARNQPVQEVSGPSRRPASG